MKQLDIDPQRCIGCRSCELACALQNDGVMAAGHARIDVIRFDQSREYGLPRHRIFTCRQCRDAPCLAVCPQGAIAFGGDDDQALCVDRDACNGCGLCVRACPFGAIRIDPAARKAYKCELCGGEPACVAICPTEAVTFVEKEPFRSENTALQMRGIAILKKDRGREKPKTDSVK